LHLPPLLFVIRARLDLYHNSQDVARQAVDVVGHADPAAHILAHATELLQRRRTTDRLP